MASPKRPARLAVKCAARTGNKMPRATKKQIAVIGDQLGRATHYLDEIGRPYVVLIEGMDKLWHNTTDRHALDLVREHIEYADKVRELRIEDKAMKQTALPPPEEPGTTA